MMDATDSTFFMTLSKSELIDAATFFGESSEGTKEQIGLRLMEAGVTRSEYNKHLGQDEVENSDDGVVKSEDVSPPKNTTREEIITKEEYEPLAENKKHLVKMERDNPLFEVRGHRFTENDPYQLMTAEDADWLLRNESGFRAAFPSELDEFYD